MVSYGSLRKHDSVFHVEVRRLTDSSLERIGALGPILGMDALEKRAERWGSLLGIEAKEA